MNETLNIKLEQLHKFLNDSGFVFNPSQRIYNEHFSEYYDKDITISEQEKKYVLLNGSQKYAIDISLFDFILTLSPFSEEPKHINFSTEWQNYLLSVFTENYGHILLSKYEREISKINEERNRQICKINNDANNKLEVIDRKMEKILDEMREARLKGTKKIIPSLTDNKSVASNKENNSQTTIKSSNTGRTV
ncbi:MAG: hypothetical protein IJX26_02590 [Clostridia bacterium]|nr:hypothetical protein [Clostridia bacterium]